MQDSPVAPSSRGSATTGTDGLPCGAARGTADQGEGGLRTVVRRLSTGGRIRPAAPQLDADLLPGLAGSARMGLDRLVDSGRGAKPDGKPDLI